MAPSTVIAGSLVTLVVGVVLILTGFPLDNYVVIGVGLAIVMLSTGGLAYAATRIEQPESSAGRH